MHPCAVDGCPESIDFQLLMCATHWRQVSRVVQREVNACWRALRTAQRTDAALGAIKAYNEVKRRAVEEARGFAAPSLL